MRLSFYRYIVLFVSPFVLHFLLCGKDTLIGESRPCWSADHFVVENKTSGRIATIYSYSSILYK